MTPQPSPPKDAFGRAISYVRVSVTDRCDLRCTYCMAERMTFLPRADLLSFEELERLCAVFIDQGVRRLRITGGEPLVRRGVTDFMQRLSRHVACGALDELTITTNGIGLARHAEALARAGVRRVNVSLDTLDRKTFARIARRDALAAVLSGIAAARSAGLRVRINTVALARDNREEIPALIRWAHERDMDICLIETMPLGDIEEDRTHQFLPLDAVRCDLAHIWTLDDVAPVWGGGPARYFRVRETSGRVGFISPLTHNFCATCNRVRLTCTGRLYMCLGQEDHIDFRDALRRGADDAVLADLYRQALAHKPRAHDFQIGPGSGPNLTRHMSATGG